MMHHLDYLTPLGAADLAAQIRSYWLMQGWEVDISLAPVSTVRRDVIWTVGSDMLNGLPRRKVPSQSWRAA